MGCHILKGCMGFQIVEQARVIKIRSRYVTAAQASKITQYDCTSYHA